MKMSRLFAPTMKDNPKGVSDGALQRLIRGGYVASHDIQEKLPLFPLGKRFWEKTGCCAEEVLLESGFQEVRFENMGKQVVGVAGSCIKSYRHLPMLFFQKEARGHEFRAVEKSIEDASVRTSEVVENLRLAFSSNAKEALSGETVSPEGRRLFAALPARKSLPMAREGYRCTSCPWCGDENSPIGGAAEPAEGPAGTPGKLETVDTPEADTIAELCRQLDVPPEKTLKTMFFAAEGEKGKEIFVVLLRGDHRISERKVMNAMGVHDLRFADPIEIRETVGDLAGYLGPVGLPRGLEVVADRHVKGAVNVVAGANEPGRHIVNVCWGRDFSTSHIHDIICFEKERRCPVCGSSIEEAALAEFAFAVISETEMPEEADVYFQAADGTNKRPVMWYGGIDLDAASVGLVPQEGPFPPAFAPFGVTVVVASLKNSDAVAASYRIAAECESAGMDVLHDERDERAGVKFSDAELIGSPVTIVCGRDAAEGKVELRLPDGRKELVPAEGIPSRIAGIFPGGLTEEGNR